MTANHRGDDESYLSERDRGGRNDEVRPSRMSRSFDVEDSVTPTLSKCFFGFQQAGTRNESYVFVLKSLAARDSYPV